MSEPAGLGASAEPGLRLERGPAPPPAHSASAVLAPSSWAASAALGRGGVWGEFRGLGWLKWEGAAGQAMEDGHDL